jgi:hypothetical protein
VPYPTFPNRIAISGDTPLCPFSKSDNALRVTPKRLRPPS